MRKACLTAKNAPWVGIFAAGMTQSASNKVKPARCSLIQVYKKEINLMQKTLDKFAVGEHGVVQSVGGEGKIKRRLFDMGITPGAEIMLRKRAPLGDPLEITVRSYELTLRITEAQCVTLIVVDETTAGEAKK